MAVWITITGAEPYDGRYEFLNTDDLTLEDWESIKQHTGYTMGTLDDEAMGDAVAIGALAVCAMAHSGAIKPEHFAEVWVRLRKFPFGRIFGIENDEAAVKVEGDARPPETSSDVSVSSSTPSSPNGSETPATGPVRTGSPAWVTSESAPPISVS